MPASAKNKQFAVSLETKRSTLVSEGSPTSAVYCCCAINMFENLTNKFEEIFSSLKKVPSLE